MILPELDVLARIAADHDPAVGDWSPRHFYGAWAEVVDRHALLTAMAHAAFLIPEGATRSAVDWWRASRPTPPAALRQAVRALEEAPFTEWEVLDVDATGATVVDPSGTRAPARVTVGRVALTDRPLERGDRLAARVAAGVAWGPIAIVESPP